MIKRRIKGNLHYYVITSLGCYGQNGASVALLEEITIFCPDDP